MKKNITVLSFILIFSLIVCLVIGFVLNVPFEVSKNSVILYKILTGFELFVKYLPVFIIAAFILTFSVHFGHHCEGSIVRFSQAMVERFKKIMIFSLVLTSFFSSTFTSLAICSTLTFSFLTSSLEVTFLVTFF